MGRGGPHPEARRRVDKPSKKTFKDDHSQAERPRIKGGVQSGGKGGISCRKGKSSPPTVKLTPPREKRGGSVERQGIRGKKRQVD